MKRHFKEKIISILNQDKTEYRIDEIVDDLLETIQEYIWLNSPYRYYHREERKRLVQIENKLDKVLEIGQKTRCHLAEGDSESIKQFITGVGIVERNKAINHLSAKLDGTKSLTICDPYFLKKAKDSSGKETAEEFVRLLPKTLRSIELYVKPRIRDKEFAESLNYELREKDIKLISRKTDDIHDRVWIKDHDEAFIVGTSFNGLGNKCAFILDLPTDDKKQFLYSLNEISRNLPKSKSA